MFGQSTERAVRTFQTDRSIDTDGICGPVTWSLLVEAGRTLGDRLLYLHSPPLRGDDVENLQRHLSTLGFSVGRIDGILGSRTSRAVLDFQRNAGLVTDGICGPDTIDALFRFSRHLREAGPMAALEERERLTTMGGAIAGRRVAVGEAGGLDVLTAAVRRAFTDAGALVMTVHHPDWSAQAQQVNTFDADLFVALDIRAQPPVVAYFKGQHFASPVGESLATALAAGLQRLNGDCSARGMALPILRETRMPAVVCRFHDVARLVRMARPIARVITEAATTVLQSSANQG